MRRLATQCAERIVINRKATETDEHNYRHGGTSIQSGAALTGSLYPGKKMNSGIGQKVYRTMGKEEQGIVYFLIKLKG